MESRLRDYLTLNTVSHKDRIILGKLIEAVKVIDIFHEGNHVRWVCHTKFSSRNKEYKGLGKYVPFKNDITDSL
jgi:hypothetical protein